MQMKPNLSDTSPKMQRIHVALMRALPPTERLNLAFELTQTGRELVLADIRHRFPAADENEVRRHFIARVLPRHEVIRVYGFDPDMVALEDDD